MLFNSYLRGFMAFEAYMLISNVFELNALGSFHSHQVYHP